MKDKTLLENALLYLSLGWSVIPVNIFYKDSTTKAQKKPMVSWTTYQHRFPTEKEVTEWWTKWPNAGIGIITGEISNLVILDLDVGYDPAKIEALELPTTLKVNTPSGGKHVYFTHPKTQIGNRAGLFGEESFVDVRGDGGFVVAPPSLYPNGVPYEWANDMQTTPMEELPQNLIELCITRSAVGKMKEALPTLDLSHGVSEGSRNSTATKVLGPLLNKFPANQWEANVWPVLKEWNSHNVPPLDERELRTVYDSITEREMNSASVEASKLGDAISLKELLGKHYGFPNWAIDGFFETATLNMISAAPNQYKSWIAHHMALCLASGNKVFDQISVTKQKVMIVNEEDTERQIKDRSLMLLDEDSDLPVYFHVSKGIKIDGPFVDKLLEEMKRHEITFLILDSLRSLHDSDENDSKQMQEVMDQLKRFTRENITVLFTHHNRKKNRGFGSDTEVLGGEESRGSSSINAAIHGHISCEPKKVKDEGRTVLIISQWKLKSAPKFEPMKIFVEVKDAKMSLTYEGDYDGKVESRNKVSTNILPEFYSGDWLSVKDLASRDLGADRLIRDALRALVSRHTLVAMTRKELVDRGFNLNSTGKNTELFYSLPTIEPETVVYDDGY